ncbi:uncharacterized protein A1O9_06514 [Exophiala aquamarina CBS 119918]|uniref:NADH:flavin oxidoreductase/NADH oxidase N-terminal domain-containing protein n=1 Tax=Exophiala aquamarina CBS 119918 TaxID=1182545 RepID=A0A072PGZ9_9EURO|nr:uncharacterized protein A1O9_06514 [Exophiala aquamarina CBS 119918]KEF58588.1 hypothetical protein A1O9_06514 [Exophiala aquamarina CBS 119918]
MTMNPIATNGEAPSKIWQPLQIGRLQLAHRVVMSPLTRARSPAGLPTALSSEYYCQRVTQGGLIISEGIHPSLMGGNYHGVPSMYSPEHIRAWKKITDAVHARGGYMFCQIWHTGRVAVSACLGGRQPLGPSSVKLDWTQLFTPVGRVPCEEPREMTMEDIKDTIADHVHSAKCAIEAGFDGVEIQGANGYLLEQFLSPGVNNSRKDAYGGSPIENRARLTLEILDAVTSAIRADRVGIRLSPYNYFQIPESHPDPVTDFTWLLKKIDGFGLAYVTVMQPRTEMMGSAAARLASTYEIARARGVPEDQLEYVVSIRPFRKALKKTPMLSSGGFDATNWVEPLERGDLDGVVFGRQFISNPDLVERLRNGWDLAPWNMKTFYTPGPEGYVDYPVWSTNAADACEKDDDETTGNKLQSLKL